MRISRFLVVLCATITIAMCPHVTDVNYPTVLMMSIMCSTQPIYTSYKTLLRHMKSFYRLTCLLSIPLNTDSIFHTEAWKGWARGCRLTCLLSIPLNTDSIFHTEAWKGWARGCRLTCLLSIPLSRGEDTDNLSQ